MKQKSRTRMGDIWTVKKILDWTTNYFASHRIPEPRLSAELLLAHVLQCTRLDLYLQFERILTASERTAYRKAIQRRMRREPVQYITGEAEFMGLALTVNPQVLIPRPETELLVENVIELLKVMNKNSPVILDIGTGSGCIAISLAKWFPEAEVWAVDISRAAVEVARKNAARHHVQIELVHGDLFTIYSQFPHKFDLIISNPPYVSTADWQQLAPEVREYEPAEALLAGAQGLDFYHRLAAVVPQLIGENGWLALEVGYNQAQTVANLFSAPTVRVTIKKDYNQIERVVMIHYEENRY